MSDFPPSSPAMQDVVRDIILWKRWKFSATILLIATTIWALLEIYQFKFVTVASWAAMAMLAFLFLYSNVLRLLHKEVPADVSRWEMTEEAAEKVANNGSRAVEESIRWMFRVSYEREWYVFGGVVAALLLLAYVAHFFDLPTLLYIGTLMGMTLPVLYLKHQDKISNYGERMRVQSRRLYDTIDDKLLKHIKHNAGRLSNNHKEKKAQ
ncbi:hypothetical protein Ancab_003752 [Ancistrocladus abbreviatus]